MGEGYSPAPPPMKATQGELLVQGILKEMADLLLVPLRSILPCVSCDGGSARPPPLPLASSPDADRLRGHACVRLFGEFCPLKLTCGCLNPGTRGQFQCSGNKHEPGRRKTAPRLHPVVRPPRHVTVCQGKLWQMQAPVYFKRGRFI